MIYILSGNDLKLTSAVLRVWGPDANTYLQGQFTQDLKLAEKAPCYGLWLDQKGKVLADSHIVKLAENDYLVVSLAMPADPLRARLEAYLIADEVEVRDATEEWIVALVWGDDTSSILVPSGGIEFPSRRAGNGARELLLPAKNAGDFVAQIKSLGREGNQAEADLTRLRAGIPSVPRDIGPRDLPAEGRLDETAISFTKGCYLGQEVIARLKNLGQVRRALHLVTGHGTPPEIGAALHQGERKIGELRSSAPDGESYLAMAMLSLVNLDAAVPLSREPGAAGDIAILRRI